MGFLAKKIWITNAAKTALGVTVQNVEDALVAVKNALSTNMSTLTNNLSTEINTRANADIALNNAVESINNGLNSYLIDTVQRIGQFDSEGRALYRYVASINCKDNVSVSGTKARLNYYSSLQLNNKAASAGISGTVSNVILEFATLYLKITRSDSAVDSSQFSNGFVDFLSAQTDSFTNFYNSLRYFSCSIDDTSAITAEAQEIPSLLTVTFSSCTSANIVISVLFTCD